MILNKNHANMPAKNRNTKPRKTQLTYTCSKSALETLERGVKYVQS